MQVALDLEEVLADTIQEACRSTDVIDSLETWGLDDYEWQVYSGVSDALWRHDPLSIPPVEDGLDVQTSRLDSRSNQLDIVTARTGVDTGVRRWLEHNDISYDELVPTDRPKYQLDYDIYIDDNPEMHGECRLLLRDQPHNRHIDARHSKMTDRIESLSEAVGFVR